MQKPNEVGLFPISVVEPEGNTSKEMSTSLYDLALDIEFYDDFEPNRLSVSAADGSPLRVIIYKIEVVLCRRVPRESQVADLEIRRCLRAGRTGQAELCQGEIHRVLWDDEAFEPVDPLDEVPRVEVVDGPIMAPRQFHDAWMSARFPKQLQRPRWFQDLIERSKS